MAEEVVGELKETGGELNMDWEIANFFSLSEEVDKLYNSPAIYFSDATWYLRIYPNGEQRCKSEGYIGMYVIRGDLGPPRFVTYNLSLRTADGKTEKVTEDKRTFQKRHIGWGVPKAVSKSKVLDRKSELAPSGVLTIVCSLKQNDTHVIGNSLLRRLQNVSASLKNVFTKGKRSDICLNVGERKFSAHKVILESRSSVFGAMFGHNMEEERTGVVNIQDVRPEAFETVLSYIYSGDVGSLSYNNVFHIYRAADKYDLKELTELCEAFMESNLSEAHVCDVIKLADLYEEKALSRVAREYFNENVKKILKTDSWETFYRENQQLAMELLAATIDKRL